MFRIQVKAEAAPLSWDEYVLESGMNRREAQKLYRRYKAIKYERMEWHLSVNPIKKKDWLCIEKNQNDNWIEVDLKNLEISNYYTNIYLEKNKFHFGDKF